MATLGRYQLVAELGRGGLGAVYKAHDPQIGRLVAIKTFKPVPSNGNDSARALEMFLREARSAGRLHHPGIVEVYDVIICPETGTPCLVMEFVPGGTLEDLLVRMGALPVSQAMDIVQQLAEALGYAHSENVIHNDLKPTNVLFANEDHVKVADFGIAEFAGRVGGVITESLYGTPAYMAPERILERKTGAQSDLFSLGVMLYRMLTGRQPFEGNHAAILYKIVNEDPAVPSHLRPELSDQHDNVVARCLAKDPKHRYTSVREFLTDLCVLRATALPGSTLPLGGRFEAVSATARREETPVGVASLWPFPLKRRHHTHAALALGLLGLSIVTPSSALKWWVGVREPQSRVRSTAQAGHAFRNASPSLATVTSQAAATSWIADPFGASAGAGTPPESLQRSKPHRSTGLSDAAPAKRAAPPTSFHRQKAVTTSLASGAPKASTTVHFICDYDLAGGALAVSAGDRKLMDAKLRGKKEKGFLGIKGRYVGKLSRLVTIPPDATTILTRVISSDGGLDLLEAVPVDPILKDPKSILHATLKAERLTLSWEGSPLPQR